MSEIDDPWAAAIAALNERFAPALNRLAQIHDLGQRAEICALDAERVVFQSDRGEQFAVRLYGRGAPPQEVMTILAPFAPPLAPAGAEKGFRVLGCERPSPNFLRLRLQNLDPVPTTPGVAYAFALGSGDHRFYTLRDVSREHSNLDVFLHGETLGSLWAHRLAPGDEIVGRREYEEDFDRLQSGQTLLIADETGWPALVAALARWQNPLAPAVVALSQSAVDQSYIEERFLPPGTLLWRPVAPVEAQPAALLAVLDELQWPPQRVWGALERGLAQWLRLELRRRHGLTGHNLKIKPYWARH